MQDELQYYKEVAAVKAASEENPAKTMGLLAPTLDLGVIQQICGMLDTLCPSQTQLEEFWGRTPSQPHSPVKSPSKSATLSSGQAFM